MTVSLTHSFVSAIPDGTDATVVRPSNWNAQHTLTGTASTLMGFDNTGASQSVTVGTGLSYSAGALTSTATGTVTSVAASGGATGLTFSGSPITTNGTLTLGGTLIVANGGTGITSFGTGVATALGQNVNGSGAICLTTSCTFVTPVLGVATATSVAMTTGTVSTSPSASTDIANKSYVDAAVANLSVKNSCNEATTAALPTNTYSNGASGVGATLTAVGTGVLTIDGIAVSLNDRILVKNEAAASHNGIYLCTLAGAVGVAYILTRATDSNTSANLMGGFTFIEQGTVNASTGWANTNVSAITIGTTAITYSQFSGAGTYTAGTGLSLTGSQFSVFSPTGSGSVVLATSPTLITPALGVATATSLNGLAITTSTGTLTVTNAKTLSVSNTLTLAGTDSTTMTFPGASATVAGLGITQTFSAAQTFSGSASALAAVLTNAAEVCTVSATAATGTINYDVTTQSVLYYTTNASANWTLNVRASSGTSLNTAMATGQSITIAFLVTQGGTPFYNNVFQVDGSAITPKWSGGTAPTAGNASGVDIYTYTIIKTGSAAFTVFASQTKFA